MPFNTLVFPLVVFSYFANVDRATSVQIIWDNSVEFDSNAIDQEFGRGDQVRLPNKYFIYPGTKWCGAGNIADGYEDLGEFRDTDKCCRNHDYCPDLIEGFQSKHNLTNDAFYTRLNCACDEEFRRCLKTAGIFVSKQVGHLYFTALGTKCYKEEYPIVSCIKYSYLPRKKCKAYQLDDTKDKLYQWFDVPNF